MLSYVWRDLARNPRRTIASLLGVMIGIGLFSGVLFFIEGSGATMTKRALEPLTLDMQRVLTNPLGGGLSLHERVSPSRLAPGKRAIFKLTLRNDGAVPAHEVVVNDQPPRPLAYLPGTTKLNGRRLPDQGGSSPLAQGLARTGLNVGTVPARTTERLTYAARAKAAVADVAALRPRGTVSSRENVVPTPANASSQLTLGELRARIARIPGVAAADALAFADLPPGSLKAGGTTIQGPVRVFGFDRRYQQHYPAIRMTSGSFSARSGLLSVEAARALAAKPGSRVQLTLPRRSKPLPMPVGGVADLSGAQPLFASRNSTKLEQFLYVPNSVVVSPATFRNVIVPAFQRASAARGPGLKSPPVEEVDVFVDRSRLKSDPATALSQTKAVARSINRIAPGQDYLIDNISNTLQVAKGDAAVAKRMFVFLGLPGILLAALLAGWAGSVLAVAQRREWANLRIRGAHRGHLMRMLVYRTLAFAGVGSLLGTGLGFVSAMAVLGWSSLSEASAGSLLRSGGIAIGIGMVITAIALYIPARRSLGREVIGERGEMAIAPVPAWRRVWLDLVLLAAAAIAEVVALRTGAFDASSGSVSAGQSVSLPSRLLVAPMVAWLGGVLLSVRLFEDAASRLPVPRRRFGPVVRGTLTRSLRRRAGSLAMGTLGVGLVVAFGVALAMFAATYDAAKSADSRFVVGSDLRVTPSVLSSHPHPPGFAAKLQVPGVSAATPVVSKLENSILIGPHNRNVEQLTAIDPGSFERVAALSDSFFVGRSAAGAMAALQSHPQGLLVDSQTADDLQVGKGDRVEVLLARGTKHEALRTFRVEGLFDRFPGFPQGTNLIANLHHYEAATGSAQTDFFLARTTDSSSSGLARTAAAIRSGPGKVDPLKIDSTPTALDKDQSSITALNVNGLVNLNAAYALVLSAAVLAIFVFGLVLQRRREYATLLAQGLRAGELRALVLGETAFVAVCGVLAGALVGTGVAYLMVYVLRPLFILGPTVTYPVGRLATLVGLTALATLAAALAATALLRRIRPTELLRET